MKIKYTKEFLSKEFLNIKKLLQGWTVHRNPGILANREIRKKINEYYPNLFSDSGELQFWFLHSKEEIFSLAFCICGNKKSWTQRSYSFTKYCGRTCYMKFEGVKILREKNLKNYGVISSNYRPDIKEKIRNSINKKYSEDKDKINEKRRLTCQKKYHTDFPASSQEISKKISIAQKSRPLEYKNEIQKKIYNTHKKNNSFNKSTPEQKLLQLLLQKFPDTLSQYRSDVYPFNCDFYIPSRDLYIEFNGSWTHGYKPFVKDNEECQKQLESWREKAIQKEKEIGKQSFYSAAIYTWTDLDVRKREVAKRNNLNYLEFFNKEEFMDWFNQQERK